MNIYPHKKEKYYMNLDGELERWEERLTHIMVTNENGSSITLLEVSDCRTYQEIHFKMMKAFWDYYRRKNEKTNSIIRKMKIRFPYIQKEELNTFLEKIISKDY
ncbi:MAG: hypothetical protein P8Z35_02465 [Ignavibacteriaceae bacterium]